MAESPRTSAVLRARARVRTLRWYDRAMRLSLAATVLTALDHTPPASSLFGLRLAF